MSYKNEGNNIARYSYKMNNNHIHPEDKFLKIYCHYPLTMAQEEYNSSQKEMYRITTINWTFATNKETGKQDHSYVHKNIYEMSLGEFQNWCIDICNEEVAEEIINIEKLSE